MHGSFGGVAVAPLCWTEKLADPVLIAACRYGTLAVISFGLAVAFRLYQEVWSNAIVVAGFFGVEVRCWLLLACAVTRCFCAASLAEEPIVGDSGRCAAFHHHEMSGSARNLSTHPSNPLSHVQHSKEWWLGATMSTLVPVVYAFTGGMRASLVTDAGQVCPAHVAATPLALVVLAWQARDDRCSALPVLTTDVLSRCRW